MSLAQAIATGDVTQLPSRRDEDWRWTDLRGLIRAVPPASPVVDQAPMHPLLGGLSARRETWINGRLQSSKGAEDSALVVRRFISASAQTSHAVETPPLVASGARTVIDSYEGAAPGYLTQVTTPFQVASDGSVERLMLLDDDAEAVSVGLTAVELAPGARFAQTVLTLGARRQRFETNIAHPGGGAHVRLDGVYRLSGQRHADLTSTVVHQAVDGTTAQLTKGVVADQARGVFQGRIEVRPGADRTDARMGHHALILSDRAEIDAKPELLIFADDVACAHGNTVGALDDDVLFYLRQRGVPHDEARALLTRAFLLEVVDRIEDETLRGVAHAWMEARA